MVEYNLVHNIRVTIHDYTMIIQVVEVTGSSNCKEAVVWNQGDNKSCSNLKH